ncbi:hypothetical protein BK139_06905 [Paenibacillus sp. FSL R5-0490]|uniref:CAP domain-containing protein n=1 Tax=Paenibacillus sp. FSL R5-0490 TaxID=1920424 RepID=UPI00096E3B1F|nr:CAP domain-containing protein [Paenibacillus sp. FSL R5-0490]OMF61561.1 hypothetical protein BK139_06905 [Paenibacillus sp. FSL R5-0490]
MNKFMTSALVLLMVFGMLSFSNVKTEAANNSFTKEEQQAVDYLNAIRSKMGLQSVKLDPALTKAANNHLNYIRLHGTYVGLSEKPGEEGFTGETTTARIRSAGGFETKDYYYSEVAVTASLYKSSDGVDTFINSVSSRDQLISPNLRKVGVAYNGGSFLLVSGFYSDENEIFNREIVYPYDGQTNVDIVHEEQLGSYSPSAYFKVDHVLGYAISIDQPQNFWADTWDFTLKNSKGQEVPVFKDENPYGATVYYYPKEKLKYDETYTASIYYANSEEGTTGSKTWSFTTKQDPYAQPPVKAEPNTCKNIKKVYWDGVELKKGQIGRLTILQDTPLYKLDGDQKVLSKTLKKGSHYRIYAFKPEKLSVGGGYYVDRDQKVKYETPSKAKLAQVRCLGE